MIAGARLPWEPQWAPCFISGRATETHQLLVTCHIIRHIIHTHVHIYTLQHTYQKFLHIFKFKVNLHTFLMYICISLSYISLLAVGVLYWYIKIHIIMFDVSQFNV